jgi:hypothetical protein
MNFPKLHHYVPRFYLDRFADESGRLWAWDKTKDVAFRTRSERVAAETHFYRMQELAEAGYDALTLEKQLAYLEGETNLIMGQWLGWLANLERGEQIPIPKTNRDEVSLFIAIQFLRTADTRDTLHALSEKSLSVREQTRLHTALMWDEQLVQDIRDQLKSSVWIFGRNGSENSFCNIGQSDCNQDGRQSTMAAARHPRARCVSSLSIVAHHRDVLL